MQAQVFYKKLDMRLEEREIPVPGDDEVLIRVRACGICGSDVSYYFGHSPLETATGEGPLILGHELSGDIVSMGKVPCEMGLFREGDRVTANPPVPCNACDLCARGYVNLCENCRTLGVSVDGAFAQYVKVRYTNVFRLPDSASYEEGALMEPFACASFGVKKLDAQPGDFVVIFGPGSIGLMMLQLVKNQCARKVVLCGIFDYPLKTAKKMGADYVFNTLDKTSPYYTPDIQQEIKKLSEGRMAQRVIVPTNAVPAMQDALKVAGKHATVVYFGLPGANDVLPVPMLETLTSEKTILFSWLAPLMWPTAIDTLASGNIKLQDLITHRFSLKDAWQGIEFMGSQEQCKIKGIVIMD